MDQETKQQLINLCESVDHDIYNIYIHWSAGYYGTAFDDYHINILGDGEVVITCESFNERKAHTWRRNTNNVGVALACCRGAMCYGDKPGQINYGDCPPTKEQIESLIDVLKLLKEGLDISTEHITTHAEVATEDGYGIFSGDPETRWDLLYIPVDGKDVPGGEYIRSRLDAE